MNDENHVTIELQSSEGTEQIKIDRDTFLKIAIKAFEQNKGIEELIIEMLREVVDEELDEDAKQELDELADEACPNCGETLKDQWSGVSCSKCKYWFCF